MGASFIFVYQARYNIPQMWRKRIYYSYWHCMMIPQPRSMWDDDIHATTTLYRVSLLRSFFDSGQEILVESWTKERRASKGGSSYLLLLVRTAGGLAVISLMNHYATGQVWRTRLRLQHRTVVRLTTRLYQTWTLAQIIAGAQIKQPKFAVYFSIPIVCAIYIVTIIMIVHDYEIY